MHTQPSYYRNGRNPNATAVAVGRILQATSTQDEVALSTAATQRLVGVSVENMPQNITRSYQNGGRAKVLSGAAFAIGTPLTTDATGRAVTAVAGNQIIGIATEQATGADEMVELEIQPQAVVS